MIRKAIGGVVTLFWLSAHPLAAGEVVIAALGDSLTQGYGLAQGDGLVPQLQQWLDSREAGVRLVNAGVSGDTTAGGLARVAWTLTPEVDAMIVTLGGNDLLRGIDPQSSRANLEGILQAAEDADVEVLLVGMRAPGNYGPEFKAAFDDIHPELAERYGTLLYPDYFAALVAGIAQAEAVRTYMQPDGIHPNAAGVARIVEAIGPVVLDLAQRAAD